MEVGERGGFATGEVLCFTNTLGVGVVHRDFECHVTGGKPEAVDAGSTPISDKFGGAACLSNVVRHVRGQLDDLGRVGIHPVSVAVVS